MTTDIINDFFPQGLALGYNFCNRAEEQARLIANIKTCRPTLVSSPRRYGKTSLVVNIINKFGLQYSHIDLYSDFNSQDVQNTILTGIGNIVYSVASIHKKALKYLTEFFADLNISFKFIGSKIQINLTGNQKSPAKATLFALEKLDELLNRKRKKIVLFFDEFQRLGQIPEALVFEGALRHIAQKSKNISFVFSGSNRHLLSHIFDESTKPFYKLCDRILLEKIESKHYEPFIQIRAKAKWKKCLDKDAIEIIFAVTGRHPYYINVLCHRAWLNEKLPSKQDIIDIWHKYALEEKSNLLAELELLSVNQFKLLVAIAKNQNIQPMSKEFVVMTKFSLSSVAQALKGLVQKDYLYIDKNQKYNILDPLIAYIFSML
jgi:uncharacterized protein